MGYILGLLPTENSAGETCPHRSYTKWLYESRTHSGNPSSEAKIRYGAHCLSHAKIDGDLACDVGSQVGTAEKQLCRRKAQQTYKTLARYEFYVQRVMTARTGLFPSQTAIGLQLKDFLCPFSSQVSSVTRHARWPVKQSEHVTSQNLFPRFFGSTDPSSWLVSP